MMISAEVVNRLGTHEVRLAAGGKEKTLTIAPKESGFGSSVSGGELLMLAMATCFCNDLYREAQRRGIEVQSVRVEATSEFAREGVGGRGIGYRASVEAKATREEILELIRHTDTVLEIQNTLRVANQVPLTECEAVPV
jgi:organic hydroperoxide reductase OsmC/OhrA